MNSSEWGQHIYVYGAFGDRARIENIHNNTQHRELSLEFA